MNRKTLKCTKLDFSWGTATSSAGNLQLSPDPLAGEGDWLPLLHRAHNVVKRRKTFLLGHTVPQKMHIRSFIGGVRATVTLCSYSALSAARPLAGLKGPKVEGPPSRGRVGPPNF